MVLNTQGGRPLFVAAVSTLLLTLNPASSRGFEPVPLPNPKIPGFVFPTAEEEIIRWTVENDQRKINQHAWGIWTALTMESDQEFNGKRLLVFETWQTPLDILQEGDRLPRPMLALNQLTHGGRVHGEESILGFVKYSPPAAQHIIKNELLSKKKLAWLLSSGAKKIPDFPVTSIVTKPVFTSLPAGDLVDGRYYQMPAWPGPGNPPPGAARPFPSSDWKQCIWIDLKNEGGGDGSVDTTCAPSGSSRTPNNTYNVDSFIHFQLTEIEAKQQNANRLEQWEQSVKQAKAKRQPIPAKPQLLAEGDFSVLQGMHVTSREITRWTWQTFWWSPTPDVPHFPSSTAIANDRPDQLKGAARNYVHAPAYSMLNPPQPKTGGENVGNSVYAYNPWLEAPFSPADLPDSEPGKYDGRIVPNNVGIQTNCMSCHGNANYAPATKTDAPNYTGDRYIDLESPKFSGTLQVDFLWSLPQNAK